MTMWLPVPILSAGKRSDVGVSSITPGVLSHQRLTVSFPNGEKNILSLVMRRIDYH
jgi:hypothetical protein